MDHPQEKLNFDEKFIKESNNRFFSPQAAFYGSQSQSTSQNIFGLGSIPNHVVFNAIQQSVTNIQSGTTNTLLEQAKINFSSIKRYFSVDQNYIMNKLSLILFPFRPRNWCVQFDTSQQQVPPRKDMNLPDYYIPLMSVLTYILVASYSLGTQNRFTPEQLGIYASLICIWSVIEISSLCLISYIFNIQSKLHVLDLIAYCGYKYVGIVVILLSFLITNSIFIYQCSFIYINISLWYFLLKYLRLHILSGPSQSQAHIMNLDKRHIFLLLIVCLQTLFIWHFTRHLIVG